MKSIKKISILVLICLCSVLMLTGCSKVEGTYKFASMVAEYGGVQVNIEAGEEFMGFMTLTEDYMVLTLEKDGKATLSSMGGTMGEELALEGTWEKDGKDKLILTFEGDPLTVTLEKDTIIIDNEELGGKITLEKSK